MAILREADLKKYYSLLPLTDEPFFELTKKDNLRLSIKEAQQEKKRKTSTEDKLSDSDEEPKKKKKKAKNQWEAENIRKSEIFQEISSTHSDLSAEQKWKWVLLIMDLEKNGSKWDLSSIPRSVLEYGSKPKNTNNEVMLNAILQQNQVMQQLILQQNQQQQMFINGIWAKFSSNSKYPELQK